MPGTEVGPVRSRQEWEQVREICCETGDAGKPIDKRRDPFFAEFWIGPYQRLLPEWTFVARSQGRVIGYLTGCPASGTFAVRRFLLHRIPLFIAVLFGRWGGTEDTRRYLHPIGAARRNLGLRFGLKLYGRLLTAYPSHLHINVREGHRTGGTGRKLVDTYIAKLKEDGVDGLHLFCGAGPVPFYRRVGFHKLACRDFGKGPVFVMARRLWLDHAR